MRLLLLSTIGLSSSDYGERRVKKLFFLLFTFPVLLNARVFNQDTGQQKQTQKKSQLDSELDSYLRTRPQGKPFNVLNRAKVNEFTRHLVVDTVNVWSFVFSLDTMRLLLPIVPIYLVARHEDERVHQQFYRCATHTNKNQPKGFLRAVAVDDGVVAIPFIVLSSLGWFSTDPYTRRQAQTFTTGLIWAWVTKIVLKELVKVDACLRPWNEHHSAYERSYGGNPSGHLTTLTFLTTYWAFQWGLPWAVPMGAYTLYAMAVNVAVNHHYLSQVVAGASLGLIFGVAAHTAFDFTKKHDNIVVGFDVTQGKPGIKLTYSF